MDRAAECGEHSMSPWQGCWLYIHSWIKLFGSKCEARLCCNDYPNESNCWFFENSKWSTLQIDVDIGSSTVANGVLGLVCGVITTLVVDMAFLVQVNKFIVSLMRILNKINLISHRPAPTRSCRRGSSGPSVSPMWSLNLPLSLCWNLFLHKFIFIAFFSFIYGREF